MQLTTMLIPLIEARRHSQSVQRLPSSSSSVSSSINYRNAPNTTQHRIDEPASRVEISNDHFPASTASFEETLATNPGPLLLFAAKKDFSAENILFLMRVREFRSKWQNQDCVGSASRESGIPCFVDAAKIWFDMVRKKTDVFAFAGISEINIRWQIYKALEGMFEGVSAEQLRENIGDGRFPSTRGAVELVRRTSGPACDEHVRVGVTVPRGFGKDVFDRAESEIRTMVLHNTWPRFKKERDGGLL